MEDLEAVAAQIAQLQKTDPARAAGLYETFLAGCKEKADELNDSMGSFGQFASDLICRWIKARQSSGASPDATAATLLGWMDNDPYAFCFQIEKEVAKALDKAGRAAFERLIRARFEAPTAKEPHDRRLWADVLRAVYLAQRNTAAYEALTQQIGLERGTVSRWPRYSSRANLRWRWCGWNVGSNSTGRSGTGQRLATNSRGFSASC